MVFGLLVFDLQFDLAGCGQRVAALIQSPIFGNDYFRIAQVSIYCNIGRLHVLCDLELMVWRRTQTTTTRLLTTGTSSSAPNRKWFVGSGPAGSSSVGFGQVCVISPYNIGLGDGPTFFL